MGATYEDIRHEIADALLKERVVQFKYQKPGEPPFTRTVSPFEFKQAGANFIGWDHDRGAIRAFKLSQIASDVTVHPDEEYVRPST